MNNNLFSPSKEINNADKLFGRNELLNQLVSLANNKNSVSITGLRRFGKTSILKCIESTLRKSSETSVYPLFIDFKEVGSIVKGTDNVYRYMISILVVRLFEDSHFIQEEVFKNTVIKATKDWEDVYEKLSEISAVRVQGIFEELVTFFSEYLEKTILFLIDEYEWLFRFSFDQPVGFMKLRNFSSKILDNGTRPFNFWIAGAIPWDYLCTITGSGELNVIDAPPIFLRQIDFDSFNKMWNEEVKKITECSECLKNSSDFAYIASGGVPYYGKLIGMYIFTNNTRPNYTLLKSYFQELVDSLQNEEKAILIEIARLPRNYKNSKYIFSLIDKGLIFKNGNNYEISIGFLKDFINSEITNTKKEIIEEIPESQVLTENITTLITNINRTHMNKKSSYIFEPVVDEAALIKDLRTPCYYLEAFSNFASSLYKIVFERTKENRSGTDVTKAKLPPVFKNNNQFIDIVDIMRHSLGGGHLMDTFNQRPGQLSKTKMLEILVGSKNEPNSAEEFYKLQIATLKMFENELNKLNSIVRSYN